MKLYEVNQAIEEIFEQMVDPETGEISEDELFMEKLSALQMEKSRILEYLAKHVLNNKSHIDSIKAEEQRLKERRQTTEHKVQKLMAILDRECAGQKTDLGVATVCYRKTSRVEIENSNDAYTWLHQNGHTDCYKVADPEISKAEVKKLLVEGVKIPGVCLVQGNSCSLK